MIGFSSLLIARHRGAFSIGLLAMLGVGAVLIVSIIVLPVLLTIVAEQPSTAVSSSELRMPGAR